ncbi:putative urease accessory protein UreF-like like [Verticillium longisporum]|uniref:Uncharacterized protein n=2 Tax=Verticillium TaxID=1036719 RepID=A0A366PRR2_VERDA|nr:putative urease accessory protein UreF-like like [Verticillium longisporum]PNH45161.1 hypothetical protein VD0004_g2660 [Verticillium dahliae]KAG7127745.1 putative urease accessory protein UreF-like like [Verticillium longisporum]PNH74836.1 hypothetical protein VD0001_g2695 [Verticillium dahliae]RBQ94414.1 hypothetical protein VDGD_08467 [Verticillium dahliae]
MDSEHDESIEDTQHEIAELEAKLAAARQRLQKKAKTETTLVHRPSEIPLNAFSSANHYILLLSDSALPLGSFAFSSGLESYLAHTPRNSATFSVFLPESISSYASTTLPFVLTAYRDPSALATLDDTLDAAIICTVGRRASIAQGRALLSIWERSFASSLPHHAVEALKPYAALLRASSSASSSSSSAKTPAGACHDLPPAAHAHLAPLFGAVASLVGLTLHQTAYVFMLSHVKALVSAAVRASMFGPYQAQKVLGSGDVPRMIAAAIEREWATPVEEAGQTMPIMDLWIGRHELLYSRIFNS